MTAAFYRAAGLGRTDPCVRVTLPVSHQACFALSRHLPRPERWLSYRRRPSGCSEYPMTCQEVVRHLIELRPQMNQLQIAQLCLLVLRDGGDRLHDRAGVEQAARAALFRLEAASDQHAAMAAELEELFGDGPVRFTADQIWTLLRAVKVQSQLLELYSGLPALA